MRFISKTLLAAGSAVVLLAASGCAGTGTAASGDPASGDSITLGAVLPLTGASATIGADQRRGIDLAVEQINAAGGVLGKKLSVAVEDSQGTANSALDAARKLVSVTKVPAVIGEYSSGVTVPVGTYLQEQHVVHLNVGSSSPAIANIGNYSFSTIGLDTLASSFTAQELIKARQKTAVVIAPNNSYGEGVATTLKAAYEQLGGKISDSVLYTEGQTDYRAELQRAKQSNPDVFVYSAYGQEAATINKQAFELGMTGTPWYGIYLTMCTGDSDPSVVEGQQGMDVNYTGPDGSAYVAAYKEKFGQDLSSTYSAYAYDAVKLVARAIEDGKSAKADDIRSNLANRNEAYAGVTGPIAFDAHNQRREQPYAVLSFTNGAIKTD
ncbi:ABC transporter substrate-binding protein [Paenarthrobacter nicotinovorans]|uniref:ABC transporter substrate-binding protein n=1 Tax=Paenarthrobacter nicotinovorans TaxID=29320 RepID=UPI0037FFD4A7